MCAESFWQQRSVMKLHFIDVVRHVHWDDDDDASHPTSSSPLFPTHRIPGDVKTFAKYKLSRTRKTYRKQNCQNKQYLSHTPINAQQGKYIRFNTYRKFQNVTEYVSCHGLSIWWPTILQLRLVQTVACFFLIREYVIPVYTQLSRQKLTRFINFVLDFLG